MRRASHRLCAAVNLLKRISCSIMLPDVNNHRTDGHGRLYVIREQGNLLLVPVSYTHLTLSQSPVSASTCADISA